MRNIIFILVFFLIAFAVSSGAEESKRFPEYEITVRGARGILDADVGKKDLTDPYLIMFALCKEGNSYRPVEVGRTPVKQNTLDPQWNKAFMYRPKNEHELTDEFMFMLIDRDPKMPRDLYLGSFTYKYLKDTDKKGLRNHDGSKELAFSHFWPKYRLLSPTTIKGWITGKIYRGLLIIQAKKHHPDVKIPSLIGKKFADIESTLPSYGGINWTYKKKMVSDESQDGVIAAQNPAAGTIVKNGSTVQLTIGVTRKVSVPDLKGMRKVQARAMLAMRGLKIGHITEKETSNPRSHDEVVAQGIKPGTTVIVPTTVDLKVAKYVQPDPVDFPDIIDMNYRDAAAALRDAGLFPAGAKQEPFDAEAGVVIRTKPDRETNPQLMPGSRVYMIVAAPDQLGVTMAFPIEKEQKEVMTLDFNKHEEYYIKFTVTEQGYVKFVAPDGNVDLPMGGELFTLEDKNIARYSDWKNVRVLRVLPGEYYVKFWWDAMNTMTDENSKVSFYHEFVPEMDPGEYNDEIESATLVQTGMDTSIAIYPENDRDWFVYEPELDGYLRITLNGVPDAIDHNFMFKIYEKGTEEDLHAGEYLPVSVKVFEGKKYYVKISVLGVDLSPETFTVNFDLVPEKDETEPNDTIDDAYVIEGSFMGDVYIMGKAEHDYFKLIPEKGAKSLTIDVEHNDYMIRPRVYWATSKAGLEDADYCKPRDKTCTIPVNDENPIYLYVYNDHAHNYSNDPMTMTIAYQYPEAEVPVKEVEEGAEKTVEDPDRDADARARSIDLAKQAYEKLKQGNYDESILLYKQAIKLYEDKRYWHDMGLAYFRLKDWKNAEDCFQKAVDMDMSYYLGYKSLGSVLGETKKYELSIQSFERALAISDKDPMIYYNLARSYEGLYLEDNTKVDELKKAFEYSSIAGERIKDNKKVSNQFKRLKSMIKNINK